MTIPMRRQGLAVVGHAGLSTTGDTMCPHAGRTWSIHAAL